MWTVQVISSENFTRNPVTIYSNSLSRPRKRAKKRRFVGRSPTHASKPTRCDDNFREKFFFGKVEVFLVSRRTKFCTVEPRRCFYFLFTVWLLSFIVISPATRTTGQRSLSPYWTYEPSHLATLLTIAPFASLNEFNDIFFHTGDSRTRFVTFLRWFNGLSSTSLQWSQFEFVFFNLAE